jgi:hypothetical protein
MVDFDTNSDIHAAQLQRTLANVRHCKALHTRAPTNRPEVQRTQRSEPLIMGSAVQVCEW